ncbi:MAG: GtrA family protein [Lachnospiraceae bacterium]|nr:GtrA family protein [Lachnospiraceae bacterium]
MGKLEDKIDSIFADRIPKYDLLKNIFLYGFFGVCAAVLELGVDKLLYLTPMWPMVVTVIGAVAGFLFTFTTNTFLNFKKTDNLLKRFISYAMIAGVGIAFKAFVMLLCYQIYNISDTVPEFIMNIILVFGVAAVQFVFNKLFTYKD